MWRRRSERRNMDFETFVPLTPINASFLQRQSPRQIVGRLQTFDASYRRDWQSWIAVTRREITSVIAAKQFEDTLRRWNACRKRGGVRNEMTGLIQAAVPHLNSLTRSDLRSFSDPSREQKFAVRELWSLLESGICLSKSASEVGISKGIMLLTRGRIGPAFDSSVRETFRFGRITSPDGLLLAYHAVADDLLRFEKLNRLRLEDLLPKGWGSIAVGRIVDMIAGPREGTTDEVWFERKVAELKAALERLPAGRQEQLRRELEEEGKAES